MMKSGWIIRYNDEFVVALSEEKYREYSTSHDKNNIIVEEHWFNIESGMKQNGIKELLLAKGE